MAFASKGNPALQPMGDLNTTPLIDVMLVLLVMLIFTIPAPTNMLQIDLPGPPPEQTEHLPIRPENDLVIAADGTLSWNGSAISEPALAATLADAQLLNPEPLVRLAPDADAPYGRSVRIVNLIKRSGLRSFAFVGNERFASFGKADPR